MTVHISARLAWHNDGWNGHICQHPKANTYCIGMFSYPGQVIRERRDLDTENQLKGKPCSQIKYIPPCCYSINAFGKDTITAFGRPPDFFHDGAAPKEWQLPPATISIWPYEVMYLGDVKDAENHYDYNKRLKKAEEYFEKIEENKSLVFYYSNYSNPFTDDNSHRYVLVGLSRVKEVGKTIYYENCTQYIKERYGGGFVWQRNITSHYPDQGLRLPYHRYKDVYDVSRQILIHPENPRNFKYATRQFGDDDALCLVEHILEIVHYLRDEIKDDTEDWQQRSDWLQSLIGELWSNRGRYPGMSGFLDYIGFQDAIKYYKDNTLKGNEQNTKDNIFDYLERKIKSLPGFEGKPHNKEQFNWARQDNAAQRLLKERLVRFDLTADQIRNILTKSEEHCLEVNLQEVNKNPYLLSEQYVGDNPDDSISFSKVDHGMLPSPDLGLERLAEKDDAIRFRALCVDQLKREQYNSFLASEHVIEGINRYQSHLPEYKNEQFRLQDCLAFEEELDKAVRQRIEKDKRYLYLKQMWDDERLISKRFGDLARLPQNTTKIPVTDEDWWSYLYDEISPLADKHPDEYEQIIDEQRELCKKLYLQPFAVLSGDAGTGKTTIIKALIKAIQKMKGRGEPICLLAPTGKATDRIREKTGHKTTQTIHSFLANYGWLNDNLTLKGRGGRSCRDYTTFIIDEASMLDLQLLATFMRSVNWMSVERFILVGDQNQLPPIGRGLPFVETIDWLKKDCTDHLVHLTTNVRQRANELNGQGTSIIETASFFTKYVDLGKETPYLKIKYQELIQRLQRGGDIDEDMRVHYWRSEEELYELMKEMMLTDMAAVVGSDAMDVDPEAIWQSLVQPYSGVPQPGINQVLSPKRGDVYGTELLNIAMQEWLNGGNLKKEGDIDGITIGDKVIQYRNRPRSNLIGAYNTKSMQVEKVQIFNGDIGFVRRYKFSTGRSQKRIKRFSVCFNRKEHLAVHYGKKLGKYKKWFLPNEEPEHNLELAYAITVHKAQGSEFDWVYFILPKGAKHLLTRELFYTALTRATRHCTLLIEEDISPLLALARIEQSRLVGINSSIFKFKPLPVSFQKLNWHEDGKKNRSLRGYLVRSKSELVIANILFDRDVPFTYEEPLFAPDGTVYLPDFTLSIRGQTYYWEHLGMLDKEDYRKRWEKKREWYEHNFPGMLVTTKESGELSKDTEELIQRLVRI